MFNRSKRLIGLATIATASLLAAAACSGENKPTETQQYSEGFAECQTKPNTCNSGPTKPGGTLVFAMEQAMSSWQINAADGTHFSSSQMMSGLIPGPFFGQPDLSMTLDTDLMVSAEQTSESPQTIVYKIRPEAVWSDGTPISGKDFQYNVWTFDGKTCPKCTPGATSGYDAIDKIDLSDNDKTVTVTFKTPYPDWKGLFSLYPAHIAQSKGGWKGTKEDAEGLAASFNYFIKTQPDWSGGPYIISSYEDGVQMTQTANPKWYGKNKPPLEKLVWRIVEDQAQIVPALRNGEINAGYPQPNEDLVTQIKSLPNMQYQLAAGVVWQHLDINVSNKYLSDVNLRKAIFTAVDRQSIIDKTVGTFDPNAKPLGNHVFMPSMKGYKDQVTATGQGQGKIDEAKKILTDAGYKDVGTALKTPSGEAIPTLRFTHTVGNVVRATVGQIFQQEMKQLGINIEIKTTDDLSGTLSNGDFDVMIFSWVGTPLLGSNLKDLWRTGSAQNYGKWSDPAFDKVADEAAQTLDEAKFTDLVNQGVKILAEGAYVLPLFQAPNLLVVDKQFTNMRGNATNYGPAYNNREWGLLAS